MNRVRDPQTGRFVAATNGHANGNGQALAVLSESLTAAITRARFAGRHGLQYSGARNIYAVGGYPRSLSFGDFAELYERDGIAGQIVDMAAETTWRHPPEVVEVRAKGASDDPTTFEKAWTDLATRLGLWGRFERLDKLSRVGQYAVLLIGTSDANQRTLAQPIGRRLTADSVLYLAAYDQGHAQIQTWVTENKNPRFGLPETYRISLAGNAAGFMPSTGGKTITVHWSRVLHVAEGLDDVYGRPALQRVFNDLMDFQKVSTSTAEGYWQRVAGVLSASIDPAAGNADQLIPDLKAQIEAIYHDLRRSFVGQGVELSRLAEAEPNPKESANLFMTRIAAGSGYPKRMLFGSETGERASSEDQKTFLGSISERQKQHAEPVFVRAFIERMMEVRVLPRPELGYDVVWPKLAEESELDVAETSRRYSESAKAQTPVGGDPTLLTYVDSEGRLWLKERKPEDPSPFADLEPVEPTGPQVVEDDNEEPAGEVAA